MREKYKERGKVNGRVCESRAEETAGKEREKKAEKNQFTELEPHQCSLVSYPRHPLGGVLTLLQGIQSVYSPSVWPTRVGWPLIPSQSDRLVSCFI